MKKLIVAVLITALGSLYAEECEEFTWAKFESLIAAQTGKTPYELIEKYNPELTEEEVTLKTQEVYEWYCNHPTELIIQEEDYGTDN